MKKLEMHYSKRITRMKFQNIKTPSLRGMHTFERMQRRIGSQGSTKWVRVSVNMITLPPSGRPSLV